MKKTYLTIILTVLVLASFAQSKASRVSIGLEAGLPVGVDSKPYSSIFGGSLQYEHKSSPDLGITLSGGYLNWAFKSSYGSGSIGFVPLLAGFKYYVNPKVFFHGQLGAAIGTARGQGTSFAYAPGIGFLFSPAVDVEIKYMGISNKGGTLGEAGLRLAYNF